MPLLVGHSSSRRCRPLGCQGGLIDDPSPETLVGHGGDGGGTDPEPLEQCAAAHPAWPGRAGAGVDQRLAAVEVPDEQAGTDHLDQPRSNPAPR
jgi:hypothetical protein